MKKPAKKRKRNQVIEEQTESTDDGKSKKGKAKDANNESAMSDEIDEEVNTTENLSVSLIRIYRKITVFSIPIFTVSDIVLLLG